MASTEGRVKSKNLFNFQPKGVIDDDILKREKEMAEAHGIDPNAILKQMQAMSDEEFGAAIRNFVVAQLEPLNQTPEYLEALGSCDHSTVSVPTTHDGNYEVQIKVHTPKSMAKDKSKPCIVYAHGGGAIAGSPDTHKGLLSHMAVSCGVVVFNVDYRLAPETRCPNNVLDFYEAIKYVAANADELGVDPARIGMAGESGGGYICAGAMVQLATQEESHLVKLAIPIIPMLDDYCFSDTAAMTKEEAEHAPGQQKIWRLIAGPDFEKMGGNPLLYPGKASEDVLRKMPPTIVWDSEFDIYLTEATRFANRLRAAGRLLEFVLIPGCKHGSGGMPYHAAFQVEREAMRLAIQEYLVK